MEQVILGLLILKSMTIYEINKAFNEGISLFYSASYGSLQTAVKKLLGKKHITFQKSTENGRNKKTYAITAEGKDDFFAWLLSDIPLSKLEVAVLSRLYFVGILEKKNDRLRVVQNIIHAIEESDAELRGVKDRYDQIAVPDAYKRIFTYQMYTLEYGLDSQRLAKDWFIKLYKSIEQE